MDRKLKWLTIIAIVTLLVFIPKTGMSEEKDDDGFMSWLSTWNPIKDHFSRPLTEKIPNFEIRGYIQNTNSVSIYKDVNKDMNIPPFHEMVAPTPPGQPDPPFPIILSYEPYEEVGWPPMRHTDTAWQKIEWFIELEPRYRPTPNLQFVLKANYLYNGAFDWDAGFSNSYSESERRLNYYRKAIQILREWYVDYIRGPVQARIGRQQVQWGKVDGRQILDMVHGVDYTRWPLGASTNPFFPAEYWRIPKWMTNIQYFLSDVPVVGDCQLQFLWIPDFEPSWMNAWPYIRSAPFQFNPAAYSALPKSTGGHLEIPTGPPPAPPIVIDMDSINPRLSMDKLNNPARNWENSEIGFMAKMFKGGWDVSLHYLWAWNDRPTMFSDTRQVPRFLTIDPPGPALIQEEIAPEILITLQPRYTRVHKFGLGADKTWSMLGRQWAAKFEGRYLRNGFYPTANWTPQNQGQRRADSLLTGLQIETYILTDMALILRWDHEQIFKYGRDLRNFAGSEQFRHQDGIFFTIIDPVSATYDRLVLRSGLAYLDNGQWRWEPVITYELTQDCNLMLGAHLFWGNPDQIFGQFERYKGIDFGMKWSF